MSSTRECRALSSSDIPEAATHEGSTTPGSGVTPSRSPEIADPSWRGSARAVPPEALSGPGTKTGSAISGRWVSPSFGDFTKWMVKLILPVNLPRWRRAGQPCCELRENAAVFRMFYLFFFLFYVLDVVNITVYDRHTLLNIGSFVAQRKPDFEFLNAGALFTDTASEPFVWAAWSRPRKRRRKREKRAGVLVRLRRRALRPPLPTILLANVQSLDNKLCELRARISYQRETRDYCIICLAETWMSAVVPDSAIELTGFSVHRSDRTKELTGKSRGGGVCFFTPSFSFKLLSCPAPEPDLGIWDVHTCLVFLILRRLFLYQQLVVWWIEICTLLNPSAPLIWNFVCFCVDHSGYRGNLQRS